MRHRELENFKWFKKQSVGPIRKAKKTEVESLEVLFVK